MADARPTSASPPPGATGCVVFADGRVAWGQGFGAEGQAVGELCFNTAMTGYQEVMTDPSYAKQVIAFTFPHIGIVGANDEDVEAAEAHAVGCLVREPVTRPSNYRAVEDFASWMARRGRIGIAGLDTRALTHLVRREGPPTIAVAHRADGVFDVEALQALAADWPGLEGMDLAKEVSRHQVERWSGGKWAWGQGYEERVSTSLDTNGEGGRASPNPFVPSEVEGRRPHVVAIDYGSKRNIFRSLVAAGARVTVLPAGASFDDVMTHDPDGFFLSNGPGDPAATANYAVPVIQAMLATGKPLFGICLG
ncbi:MAG: carbamoyl-phosphate synthase domain-containing protein, partial [Sphingomicrobium sp.]